MANSIGPDETALLSRLIWIYAVCKGIYCYLFWFVEMNKLKGECSPFMWDEAIILPRLPNSTFFDNQTMHHDNMPM